MCALGDDAGGATARELAAHDGFALIAEASSEPTGTAGIYVDARGRNTIVIGPGANAALGTDFLQQQQALLAGAKVVLVQLESPVQTIEAALATAREAGVTTVLNTAPADALDHRPALLADVITPNETEFAALLGRHVGERVDANDVAALDGASLHALCRKLVGNGTVVVTLGSVGVFVSHADENLRGDTQPYYRVGAEQVQAIDTTGAGDAFNGALAASLAQVADAPFARHVRFANQFAGRSTEKEGAAAAMPRFTPADAEA